MLERYNTIQIGSEFVTIETRSGKNRQARILERTTTAVLCDRIVHQPYETYQGPGGKEYRADGCFVTEFALKG